MTVKQSSRAVVCDIRPRDFIVFCFKPGEVELIGEVTDTVFRKGDVVRIAHVRAMQFAPMPQEDPQAPPAVGLDFVHNHTKPDYWDVVVSGVAYSFRPDDRLVSMYLQHRGGLIVPGAMARPEPDPVRPSSNDGDSGEVTDGQG